MRLFLISFLAPCILTAVFTYISFRIGYAMGLRRGEQIGFQNGFMKAGEAAFHQGVFVGRKLAAPDPPTPVAENHSGDKTA